MNVLSNPLSYNESHQANVQQVISSQVSRSRVIIGTDTQWLLPPYRNRETRTGSGQALKMAPLPWDNVQSCVVSLTEEPILIWVYISGEPGIQWNCCSKGGEDRDEEQRQVSAHDS